jgi:hypothetical protein
MVMPIRKKFLGLLLASFALASCGSHPHPKMMSFTPASVVIDYSENDLHEATGMAQQYCSSMERDAQYVRTEESGWVSSKRIAFFNCIESLRKSIGGGAAGSNSSTPIINNFR